MSDFDKLKTKKVDKPKVWLEGVNFDFEKSEDSLGPHIHYVKHAASLMDDPLILKSKDISKNIIESVIDKSTKTDNNKSMEKGEKTMAVDEKTEEKDVNKTVSMEEFLALKKQVETTDKENRVLISKGLIKDYKFSEDVETHTEIEKGVSEILAGLETEPRELLVKAFDAVIANLKTEDVKKAKDKNVEGNPLRKALETEVGSEDGKDKDALLKGDSANAAVDKEVELKKNFRMEMNKAKGIKEDADKKEGDK